MRDTSSPRRDADNEERYEIVDTDWDEKQNCTEAVISQIPIPSRPGKYINDSNEKWQESEHNPAPHDKHAFVERQGEEDWK